MAFEHSADRSHEPARLEHRPKVSEQPAPFRRRWSVISHSEVVLSGPTLWGCTTEPRVQVYVSVSELSTPPKLRAGVFCHFRFFVRIALETEHKHA
jgi:hypothetical protein